MQDKYFPILEKFKIPLVLSFLGIVLIIGGVFASNLNKSSNLKKEDFPKESLVDNLKMISVDVSGAVTKPGVYQLKEGSRIEDAIKVAEGFLEESNFEYISKYLNLAQKLSDGTKIYVPFKGEQVGGSLSGVVAGASIQSKVNINTASESEIEGLPGIGPVTASKIITSRPYQKAEDLLSKKAVSNSVFEKIKDLVVVY